MQYYYANPDKQTNFASFYVKRMGAKGSQHRKKGTAKIVLEEEDYEEKDSDEEDNNRSQEGGGTLS